MSELIAQLKVLLPRVSAALAAAHGDIKALATKVNGIGNLADLTTADKSSLVGAVNEVKAGGGSGGPGGFPQYVGEFTTPEFVFDPESYLAPAHRIVVEHGLGTEALAVTMQDQYGLVAVPVWFPLGPDSVMFVLAATDGVSSEEFPAGRPLPSETFRIRIDGTSEPHAYPPLPSDPLEWPVGLQYGDLRLTSTGIPLGNASAISFGILNMMLSSERETNDRKARWGQTLVHSTGERAVGLGDSGALGVMLDRAVKPGRFTWRFDTPDLDGETVLRVMTVWRTSEGAPMTSPLQWLDPDGNPHDVEVTIPAGAAYGGFPVTEEGTSGMLNDGDILVVEIVSTSANPGRGLAVNFTGLPMSF